MSNKEKTITEDLEQAAEEKYPRYWKKYPKDGVIRSEEYYDVNAEKRESFIAGAQWQKGQFEKNRLAACDNQTKEEYERETDFATSIIEKEHRQPTYSDAIEYGMRLQKEQMLKDAVEGFIFQSADYYPKELIARYDGDLKMGDKVKIIIVKED